MPKKSKSKARSQSTRSSAGRGQANRPQKSRARGGTAIAEPPVAKTKKRTASKSKKTASKKKRRVAKKAPKPPVFTAATADKHVLYQLAVQSPEEDVKFLRRTYKALRGKHPQHLREDFCGTAVLASHWIQQGEKFTAEGFDIDPDPLGWGVEHNFEWQGEDASRCTLHLKDVREPSIKRPDIRVAFNFSYCLFKTRDVMVEYMTRAFEDIPDDGLFILDIHGGPESMEEMEEEREVDEGFDYVWEQERYWPATGDYKCHIHFEFDDGTAMKRAFSYDWRLWSLPEIVDCLRQAGFTTVESYWEGTDEDGESGDGNFRKKKKGENCLSWIAYIVCQK